jgi:hypothetical protein
MATVYGTEIKLHEEAKAPNPTEKQAQGTDPMDVDDESHEKPEPQNQQGRKGKQGKTPTADRSKPEKNNSDQQPLDHRNQEGQNQDRTHQALPPCGEASQNQVPLPCGGDDRTHQDQVSLPCGGDDRTHQDQVSLPWFRKNPVLQTSVPRDPAPKTPVPNILALKTSFRPESPRGGNSVTKDSISNKGRP